MNYSLVAPGYNATSAGIRALWKLQQDLIDLGQTVRMCHTMAWDKVDFFDIAPLEGDIVIYPDCFKGNPWKAKHVVRLLMMHAGYFGGDKDFPETEMLWYHSPDFVLNGRSPENILSIPHAQLFPYRPPYKREGSAYLAIKFQDFFGQTPSAEFTDYIRITKETDLEELFSRIKYLWTFDNSAINLEAALCGITVLDVFNKHYEKRIGFGDWWDWDDVTKSYAHLKCRYYEEQLPAFIERTQAHFANC